MYKLGDKVLYNDTEHIITGVPKKDDYDAYDYLINREHGIMFSCASDKYYLLEGTTKDEVYGVDKESLTLLNMEINFDTL